VVHNRPRGVFASPAMRSTVVFLLPILSGCLLAAAFPPINWNDLVWVGLIPFAAAVASKRAGSAYLGAYVGGLAFYLIGTDWIRTAYGATGFSTSFAIAWFATGQLMVPSWLVTMGFARFLHHRLRWPMCASLGFGFTTGVFFGGALCRLATGSGFPWLELAATQSGRPWLIQVADLGGSSFITFVIALINGCWFDLASPCARIGRTRTAIIGGLTLALACAYGVWRIGDTGQTPTRRLTALLMPSDSPVRSLRWDNVPAGNADLLFWPEGALTYQTATERRIVEEIESHARRCNCAIVAGCQRVDIDSERNSLVFVDRHKPAVFYDKHCLVPWTEYVPRVLTPFMSVERTKSVAGTSFPSFDFHDLRAAPAICFDACFADFLRRYQFCDFVLVAGSEVADPGLALHESLLQVTRLRAVELRRPILRNVVAGYCGIITSDGQDAQMVHPNGHSGAILTTLDVPTTPRRSLYAACGDVPLAGAMLAALGASWIIGRRRELRMLVFLPSGLKGTREMKPGVSIAPDTPLAISESVPSG
jgi:apolipoprotein N-acyltransferase